jgi:hypothetical protein
MAGSSGGPWGDLLGFEKNLGKVRENHDAIFVVLKF